MSKIFATSPPRFPVPHAPLPLAVWLVAEDAIRMAWVRLRQRSPERFDLTTADEDAITLKLHEILVDEVYGSGQVEGFDDTMMHIGSRESKIRNFDGQHPDKMPDLHSALLDESSSARVRTVYSSNVSLLTPNTRSAFTTATEVFFGSCAVTMRGR
ncbi:MAG: hypothetical protein JWP89_1367 [Schlesneria sp.]|nr:hypothetical protein [Schlesneria sp.]